MTYEQAVNSVKQIKRNADRLKLRIAFCDKRESDQIKDKTAEWLCLAEYHLACALSSATNKEDPTIDYREKILVATRMAFDRGQITVDEFSAIVSALGELPL